MLAYIFREALLKTLEEKSRGREKEREREKVTLFGSLEIKKLYATQLLARCICRFWRHITSGRYYLSCDSIF